MSSDNRDLAKKIAVGAVIGLGGALGLYYLLKKYRSKPGTSQNTAVEGRTVEELKQMGNKLFSAKKYHEAIEIFTRAIELEEAGAEGTKAMCYQNRGASKERASNFSDEDALEDYAAALEMNPNYGKAYLRRGVLFQKNQKYREALVEIFCGTHLDSTLEKNANGLIPLIIEELEKMHHSEFNKNHSVGQRKPVRHERVYAWLNKTVVNDPLKRLVLSKREKTGKLGEALQLIQEHKYDDVAAKAAEEDRSEFKLEALLLAAKFSAYENCLTETRKYLDEFTAQYNSLIELEKEAKKDLLSSKFIIEIETAPNKEAVLKMFYEAIATDIRNIDYYAMAAFRLVIYGEAHEAMKILSTQDIEENSNIKLLRLTLGILANSDGNPNAAGLHTAIIELETFVRDLERPSAYASTLLAKVYSTFSQAEPATELMAEVIKSEPDQSIHYFDRGCMSSSGEEALVYLKKCLELEPYHAEGNLMYASLMLNEIGSRIMTKEEYNVMIAHLDRALETFDGAPDFPVVTGVFRLREVLEAKLIAGKKLGLIEA